jgi:hypothetical protein
MQIMKERHAMPRTILFIALCLLTAFKSAAQNCDSSPDKYSAKCNVTCPDYTKKYGAIGERQNLPEGYMVIKGLSSGLAIVNVRQGEPATIPNTNDALTGFTNPDWIRLSNDGKWILFRTKTGLTLIKIDGSGKTPVGVANMCQWGFVRQTAKSADEIWWWAGGTITGQKVDLSGTKPSLGQKRNIVSGVFGFACDDWRRQVFVAGDHAYGAGSGTHPTWLTLSSGYQWRYSNPSQTNSCGHCMSWDGTLTSENPAPPKTGGPWPCIPANGLHTGPVITPFFGPGTPGMAQMDMWHTKAISLNFCPEKYYVPPAGQDPADDFHFWNWSNYREYMSCRHSTNNNGWLTGNWVLHWPSNTWTNVVPLKPGGSNASAVFFTDSAAVGMTRPPVQSISWREFPCVSTVFDIRGRMVGKAPAKTGIPQGIFIIKSSNAGRSRIALR